MSPDAEVREDAVEELRDNRSGPPLELIPLLLRLAERERDREVIIELLKTLGTSGLLEARMLIDRHVLSPDEGVRKAARWGLMMWLRRNRILDEGEKLPDPPHPLYGEPPVVALDLPAGMPLRFRLSAEYFDDDRDVGWVPPPRDVSGEWRGHLAPAPGFVTEVTPRWGLLAPPLATFFGGWVFAMLASGMADRDVEDAGMGVIPFAGPIWGLAHDDVLPPIKALYVLSALAQFGGPALLPLPWAGEQTKIKAAKGGLVVVGSF